MKIKINENNKIKELELIDPKTGIDWLGDLMQNDLTNYDENTDCYVLNKIDFEWWHKLVVELQPVEDRLFALRQTLDNEKLDELEEELQHLSCELENHAYYLNKIISSFE